MTELKTDRLIALLAADAAPGARRLALVFAIAILGGAGLSLLLLLVTIGPRGDLVEAAQTARLFFKFTLLATLLAVTLRILVELARPAVSWRGLIWPLSLVPLVLVAGVAAELWMVPGAEWSARLIGRNAAFCVALIPLLGLAPLLALLAAMRTAAPARGDLAGLVCGIVGGGLAGAVYALHCRDDSPLFVATWYPIGIGLVALAGYLLGPKVLRW